MTWIIVSCVYAFIHLFFMIAVLKRNLSVIDIAWGLGFVLMATLNFAHYPFSIKNLLIWLAVTIWGLRLAIYLFHRNWNQAEDFRYAQMRECWNPRPYWQAYFKVFLLQASIMLVVGLPILFGFGSHQDLGFVEIFGGLIWLMGFSLEVVSDAYLSWFKKQPHNKGKICTTGPWRICRFPNYLGEVLLWYGIYFLAFDIDSFWTILGPITIHFFIVKISGIPFLEKRYQHRDDYKAYCEQVPRFFPLRLKKKS